MSQNGKTQLNMTVADMGNLCMDSYYYYYYYYYYYFEPINANMLGNPKYEHFWF